VLLLFCAGLKLNFHPALFLYRSGQYKNPARLVLLWRRQIYKLCRRIFCRIPEMKIGIHSKKHGEFYLHANPLSNCIKYLCVLATWREIFFLALFIEWIQK